MKRYLAISFLLMAGLMISVGCSQEGETSSADNGAASETQTTETVSTADPDEGVEHTTLKPAQPEAEPESAEDEVDESNGDAEN